ncbi:hypothetical protein SAMN05421505_1389 [Sinosporangium album]|uniref:Uncharacterized protein n=1 Tax=Sinosporangium album TaxID=504805 RepID=A0A1G8IMM7_9ACTN|nr:hypothetical protein [Sinosporangium album]SDI20092.1 hypothetical protein SAMN05421505_1389 [Sinosporangium album]
MDSILRAAVRRFPLVGRARPACPSLPERVQEIAGIADTAARPDVDPLHEGAHALNKAALLASDCGLPDLARELCWQHINVYREADHPLTVLQARYMLEPALNLARLQIRADAGQHALRLLDSMYQAARNGTDLVIEGRRLPLANVTGTRQEHHKLREWVWLQYLADGIRVLALADRWDEAVTHARVHNGVGMHLLEGRQAEIITHCLHGEAQAAQKVLEECTLTEPWEHLVGSCLSVMCADRSSASAGRSVAAMVEQFLGSVPLPGFAVFRARLGLTVATLVSSTASGAADRVHARVAEEVVESGDGYAARDVLTGGHPLSATHRQALTGLVASAGLGTGELPEPLLDVLIRSTKIATDVLTEAMRLDSPPPC